VAPVAMLVAIWRRRRRDAYLKGTVTGPGRGW
jgi:hypothetical protein